MAPPRHLRVHPNDDVVVATAALTAGSVLEDDGLGRIVVSADIPAGHKVAARALARGERVRKFDHVIGVASADVAPGDHVHTHNLAFVELATASTPDNEALLQPAVGSSSFQGYARACGRVGTRNYVAVLASVNCSASVVRRIAAHFTADRLAAFPNVDGVVAFTHSSGCGMAYAGDGIANLRRTIAGYATNPNVGGALLVGLGCEVNQLAPLMDRMGLAPSDRLATLVVQQEGGTGATIAAGVAAVERMLALVDQDRRSTVSSKHLIVGLQCGGSDGYSALTANPALGYAADLVVANGGTVILSETPEIYGAESLLLRRTAHPEVADALRERLDWWKSYAASSGADLNNNPSPGNLAGGITTILEKSLGAVAKAGSSSLNAVLRYAERVRTGGLVFMDSPGYDPCSATGQIAAGANLIAFTTGRGSAFGSKPAPTLKLSSNSALARTMADDIDLDCGRALDGTATLDGLGREIFAALLEVASGQRTRSEQLGYGDEEFIPWVPGAMM